MSFLERFVGFLERFVLRAGDFSRNKKILRFRKNHRVSSNFERRLVWPSKLLFRPSSLVISFLLESVALILSFLFVISMLVVKEDGSCDS